MAICSPSQNKDVAKIGHNPLVGGKDGLIDCCYDTNLNRCVTNNAVSQPSLTSYVPGSIEEF
jgi:hypothetical protein